MLELVLLTTQEQFIALKKYDLVIVHWSGTRHRRLIESYNIHGMHKHLNELILHKRNNDYIDVSLYLDNKSYAKQVYTFREK